MPRKPRVLSSTGIYHIVLRSVNQHIIFEEDFDYKKFLFTLSDCKMKYDIKIYAYCLMDNHIHILLNSTAENLPLFFQSLGTRFVRWYNNKYLRTGHLFQDRFYSTVIEDVRNFLAALVYIHNNPVKANMCRYPSEYKWSSCSAYYNQNNPLVDLNLAYDIVGSRDYLLDFFAKDSDNAVSKLFSDDHKIQKHFFTDEKALEIFKSVTHLASTSEVITLNKTERNFFVRLLRRYGLTIRQIARLMDISEKTVKRLCENDPITPSLGVKKENDPITPSPGVKNNY